MGVHTVSKPFPKKNKTKIEKCKIKKVTFVKVVIYCFHNKSQFFRIFSHSTVIDIFSKHIWSVLQAARSAEMFLQHMG